jgi:4-hydroxy-3-polyprenylbenzoate decarboxylase
VVIAKGTPKADIWKALHGAAFYRPDSGKICIAVSEDIDTDNMDAVFWSMSYRMNPTTDIKIVGGRGMGHGPVRERDGEEDGTLMIDATMKADLPPLALPKREYMEHAKKIWDELGLPHLSPRPPWHGYSLGDWLPEWDAAALRAVKGLYEENGRISETQRVKGVKPETKFRPR